MAPGQLPDYTILGLAVIFFIAWWFLWFIHMVAIIHASRRLYRSKMLSSKNPETPLPGVSILKPITGVDPNLYNNLETFFQMDYPKDKYELLFCVQEKEDPAIDLIESLRAKNPLVNSSLFVGGENVGINPKINNLMPGYKSARFEYMMVSDAGLRMLPETLLDMVSYLNDVTVLVHQLPYVCYRMGFAGILEMVYFGCQQARMYLVADFFGFACLTGMSFIIKREIVEEAGGLQVYGKYIAEDYFLAQTVLRKNLRTTISSLPALQNSGICNVRAYQERMIRWIRLRVHMLPHLLILEPCQECIFLGVLSSWAVMILFEWNFLVFFLIHLLVWFLLDYLLVKLVQGSHLTNFCKNDSGDSSKDSSSSTTMSANSSAPTGKSGGKSLWPPDSSKPRCSPKACCCGCCPSASTGSFDSGGGVGVGVGGLKTPSEVFRCYDDASIGIHRPRHVRSASATTTRQQQHPLPQQPQHPSHFALQFRQQNEQSTARTQNRLLFPVSKFDFLISWIFREFTVMYLFLKAISTNKVTWRTGSYRLEWGGTATNADPPLKSVVIA